VALDDFKAAAKQLVRGRTSNPGQISAFDALINAAPNAAIAWHDAQTAVLMMPAPPGVLGCCTYVVDGQTFKIGGVTEAECQTISPDHSFAPGPCP
jgi:hypothetical protein